MTPRFTFQKNPVRIQSIISQVTRVTRFVRRPPKAALGVAAAAAVATAGIATAVSTGPAPGPDALNHAGSVTRTVDVDAARHAGSAGTGSAQSRSAHQARRHALAASRPAATHHAVATHHAAATHQTAAGHRANARHAAPAKHAAARHHKAAPVTHRHSYRIYDSVTPSALPAHQVVATYATGNYAASPAQVAGRKTVLWIDITGHDTAASVLDVEPGNATPALAASWAWHRLHAHPRALARIYTMKSEWPAVKAAISRLPAKMRSHIRYWIADPTGYPHIVPGSSATQWYWGSSYDISTATPRF